MHRVSQPWVPHFCCHVGQPVAVPGCWRSQPSVTAPTALPLLSACILPELQPTAGPPGTPAVSLRCVLLNSETGSLQEGIEKKGWGWTLQGCRGTGWEATRTCQNMANADSVERNVDQKHVWHCDEVVEGLGGRGTCSYSKLSNTPSVLL